ncbi:MAG: ion transporter [Deltaproteobacteria bacterium]|nr:ion transporter [Deltaproteobacteria bacterium]
MRFLRAFVAEPVVVAGIIVSTIAVFAHGFTTPGSNAHQWWMTVDLAVVTYFAVEQAVKIRLVGWREYWRNNWNRFDLLVVLMSMPVLAAPTADTSVFLGVPVLRLTRLFRLFRLLRFIPDHQHLAAGIRRAIRASVGVFLAIAIVNFIFAMGGQALFAADSPEYFGDPLRACYSMFRIFTIEGWNDIPDAIAAGASEGWGVFARIYFGVAVLVGGILGLSLGNAVFVDQMMADNTDDVERRIAAMTVELGALRSEIRGLHTLIASRLGAPTDPTDPGPGSS